MGIIVPDLASCQAIQSQVDVSLGYPSNGTNIGGGIHAPASQCITITYREPLGLMDGTYAYVVDDVSKAVLTPAQQAQVQTIPSNLLPPIPTKPSVAI